jgi:hypothetical protein
MPANEQATRHGRHRESHRFRRGAIWALAALSLAAGLVFVFTRATVLRAAGWALVASEPITHADIIVIAPNSDGAGPLEAADLVRGGVATRVAVFTSPPTGDDHEFIRRGVPYDDFGARQIRQLGWLGIENVIEIPRTAGVGDVLPGWCDKHQFGSVVYIAARDSSRRMQRVLDRFMKGHRTRVRVQPARFSDFDPDRWWETRGGIRTALIELQRLALDIVRHPTQF